MFLHWFPAVFGSLFREGLFRSGRSRWFSVVLVPLAVAACNNDKISVYQIPKENNQVSLQTGSGNLAPAQPSNPASWSKPDGWTEKALSEMQVPMSKYHSERYSFV